MRQREAKVTHPVSSRASDELSPNSMAQGPRSQSLLYINSHCDCIRFSTEAVSGCTPTQDSVRFSGWKCPVERAQE